MVFTGTRYRIMPVFEGVDVPAAGVAGLATLAASLGLLAFLLRRRVALRN